MGTQSTAKTIFLLVSMVGWLLVGAALMYLTPATLNLVLHSDTTQLWMTNLSRGGYNPQLALLGGGLTLILTVLGNVVWYRQFDDKF